MVRRTLAVIALLCALSGVARAQNLQVQAELDSPVVRMGEHVTLRLTVQGEGQLSSPPRLPALPDFDAYSGGQQQSINMINGTVTMYMQYEWSLVPHRPGRFTIGALSVEVDGQTYETEPLSVEVLKGVSAPVPQRPPSGATTTPPPVSEPDLVPAPPGLRAKGAVFVTAEVDNARPYVGQQVTYLFRFYRLHNLEARASYDPPVITGFLSEDLPPQRNYVTEIDGSYYAVSEVRMGLFPTAAGKLTIGAARAKVHVEMIPDFPDIFSTSGLRDEMSLDTQPLEVEALALPTEGRPEDFTGAVGQFTLHAALDRGQTAVGQAATLDVVVKGEGNIPMIGAPAMPPLKGFKVYDPAPASDVSKKDWRISGTRKFSVALVPTVPGKRVVEGIHFSYFDPAKKAYVTLEADPLTLVVTGTAVASSPPGGARASAPSDGMRDIHTTAALAPRSKWIGSRAFVLAQALPAALLLAYGGMAWARRRGARKEPAGAALRAALARLRTLRRAPAGVAELAPVVHGWLDARLGRPTTGLEREDLMALLRERGVASEDAEALRGLLDACDALRYAPAPSIDGRPASLPPGKELARSSVPRSASATLIDDAAALLGRMERSLS